MVYLYYYLLRIQTILVDLFCLSAVRSVDSVRIAL